MELFCRGTSIVKPSKPGQSSESDSDKQSTNSSISLTDDKYKKYPLRSSFISERRSFKVFKSNYTAIPVYFFIFIDFALRIITI